MPANRLVLRHDNKFDLDSDIGQDIFKNFLETLEKLFRVINFILNP